MITHISYFYENIFIYLNYQYYKDDGSVRFRINLKKFSR